LLPLSVSQDGNHGDLQDADSVLILGGFRSFDQGAELYYPRKLTTSDKDHFKTDKLHLFNLKTMNSNH